MERILKSMLRRTHIDSWIVHALPSSLFFSAFFLSVVSMAQIQGDCISRKLAPKGCGAGVVPRGDSSFCATTDLMISRSCTLFSPHGAADRRQGYKGLLLCKSCNRFGAQPPDRTSVERALGAAVKVLESRGRGANATIICAIQLVA